MEVEDRRSGGSCFHWDPQFHSVGAVIGCIGWLHFALLFDEMLGSLYNLASRPSFLDPATLYSQLFTIYMFPFDIVSTLMISL